MTAKIWNEWKNWGSDIQSSIFKLISYNIYNILKFSKKLSMNCSLDSTYKYLKILNLLQSLGLVFWLLLQTIS